MSTEEDDSRTYAVELPDKTLIVRAKTNKQAVGFVARREEQRIRDLAVVRIATFEDGIEAERHGVEVLDATRASEDPHQLGLGNL